jgi:hypothetical protein
MLGRERLEADAAPLERDGRRLDSWPRRAQHLVDIRFLPPVCSRALTLPMLLDDVGHS